VIHFSNQADISVDSLISLYESVGWSAYTTDPAKLARAIANSSLVISAWQENKLVGLIRCMTDNETIAYIQDILVNPDYQGQGIGDELMRLLLANLKGIRQIVLMTDEGASSQHLHDWYRKFGFKTFKEWGTIGFAIITSDSQNNSVISIAKQSPG